jgi:hypothetical protein
LEVPPWSGIANQQLIDHCLPDGQEEIAFIDRFLVFFLHRHGQKGTQTHQHYYTIKVWRNQGMHHLKLMA